MAILTETKKEHRVKKTSGPGFFGFSGKPVIRDTLKTTFWAAMGKGAGFLVPFFIAAWFGATRETDAFFFVYGIVIFLGGTFAATVENVIVPYIAEIKGQKGDVGAFIGSIIVISSAALAVLTLFFILAFKIVLPYLTDFPPVSLSLINRLLAEVSPLIILLMWTSVLAGALNAHKNFLSPALSPAVRAAVCLAVILALKDICGTRSIIFGYIAGETARVIFLSVKVFRIKELRIKFFSPPPPGLRCFYGTFSYQVIASMALGANIIIDRVMSSWLGEGSVSVIHYAETLYTIPAVFLTGGLNAVLLSYWSVNFYGSSQGTMFQDARKALKAVLPPAGAAVLFLLIFHPLLAKIFLARGAFDLSKIPEVSSVFFFYLLGLFPYVWRQIYGKGILIRKDTRSLMKCAFYMSFLNILLNSLLMRYFKTSGIAMATSLVSVFALIYLRRSFYAKTKKGEGFCAIQKKAL